MRARRRASVSAPLRSAPLPASVRHVTPRRSGPAGRGAPGMLRGPAASSGRPRLARRDRRGVARLHVCSWCRLHRRRGSLGAGRHRSDARGGERCRLGERLRVHARQAGLRRLFLRKSNACNARALAVGRLEQEAAGGDASKGGGQQTLELRVLEPPGQASHVDMRRGLLCGCGDRLGGGSPCGERSAASSRTLPGNAPSIFNEQPFLRARKEP